MSSYDEHLISMAGGDGDELGEIEARRRAYMRGDTSQQTIFEIVEDGARLLALVREQAAKLEAVLGLAALLSPEDAEEPQWHERIPEDDINGSYDDAYSFGAEMATAWQNYHDANAIRIALGANK